jgi:hypothetical protein
MAKFLITRCLLSLWVGIALYGALAVSVGPGGLVAQAGLSEGNRRMRGNLERLRLLNAGLGSDLESLRLDPDRAEREARALGYLGKDQTEIVILGKPGQPEVRASVGEILLAGKPDCLGDDTMKLLAGSAVLVSLGASMFGRRNPLASRRKPGRWRKPHIKAKRMGGLRIPVVS